MSDCDAILRALDQRAPRALDLQRGMTSFPALDPAIGGEGEWRKMEWLEARIRELGITEMEYYDAPDPRVPSGKRPNRVVRVPGKSGRYFWVLGHLDVVPPGELSMWKSDPFTLTVDENDPDLIRGRGVEDNQQALVAGLLTAIELKEQGITPDIGIGIIMVADEETGNDYGVDYLLAQKPDLIGKDDLVIVPDFGTAEGDMIEVAEKGVMWLKITVIGTQCHGSTPDEGHNSLLAAAHMIMRCHEVEKRFNATDNLFNPPRTTLTPTKHEANVPNVNTMPGKDVFYLDCRVLPCYDMAEIHRAFQALGKEIAMEHGVSVDVEVVNIEAMYPPTDPDAEVVQKLKDAIFNVYGIKCHAGGVGGSTVAGRVRGLGVPAAVWARVIPNYHQPNESCRLSSIVGDAKVYAHMLFGK